jgi:glycosyltransferase involved in cell wall biosynthesis
MVERKRVLMEYVVSYDKASSIPIYIQNLIKALNLLEDGKKPFIYLCYTDDAPLDEVKAINYPYINFVPRYSKNLAVRIINKIYRVITKSNSNCINHLPKNIDAVFPYFESTKDLYGAKRIEWITDFQQLYYPDFFPKDELEYSIERYKTIAASGLKLVFSSQDAKNDYLKFYPVNNNKISILRFASILPKLTKVDLNVLFKKYDISTRYFITPNQFWPHKNHKIIVDALELLVNKYPSINIQFVFTGKTKTYRDERIYLELVKLIEQKKLSSYFKFTGFIPRQDQILLMKNSIAVIQPSLFEGWSTLVEECKALNKFIILTELNVHLEQIKINCAFFNAHNSQQLASEIEKYLLVDPSIVENNYNNNILGFANDLIELL